MKLPNDPKPEPVYNNDRVILGQDGKSWISSASVTSVFDDFMRHK